MRPDLEAPLRFLRAAFEPGDWLAVLLKSHEVKGAVQRIAPVAHIASPRFQAWLRAQNARKWSVFVGVNAVGAGSRSRTRVAISAIRNIFLDADRDGPTMISEIARRPDLPAPTIVVSTSTLRLHVLWRVAGFGKTEAEALQRQLAAELGTDRAAVACTQMTRLPGFVNYKHRPPSVVSAVYSPPLQVVRRSAFPAIKPSGSRRDCPPARSDSLPRTDVLQRARRYLAAIPPAVEGRHGDETTFRVCCRLVRGFALSDEDAMAMLATWNAACEPPWRTADLRAKLKSARRYGREVIGGLLRSPSSSP